MKKWLSLSVLLLTSHTCAQPLQDTTEAAAIEKEQKQKTNLITNSPLVFSILYGSLSGYTCRIFERHILNDIMPLRLINLWLWGAIERSVLQDFSDDLNAQHITHGQPAVNNIARVVSWLSYFMA